MSIVEIKTRQRKLMEQLNNSEIVILFAAPELGVSHCYRQHDDFYYLTEFPESHAVAVLLPTRDSYSYILFSRTRSANSSAVYYHDIIGQDRVRSEFMADESLSIDTFDGALPELLLGKSKVYSNLGFCGDSGFHNQLTNCIGKIAKGERLEVVSVGEILHQMRLVKDSYEIASIRRACEIASRGHLRAMKNCVPGMMECALAAELLYEFTRLGGRSAFETIVAGGANGCILHYSRNDQKLVAGDLVVVDAGVEYEHYVSDISRTYPVNGKFTEEQRILYELVLAAQCAVIREIKPGITWQHLQLTANKTITQGLVELGLLRGEVGELIAQEEHRKFTVHSIGHWLGLEVHDVGGYLNGATPRCLVAGMVFTVEPGIYLSRHALKIVGCDNKWSNLGIRIEDDILVTDDGCEILTASVPKEIDEIEYLMGGHS